MRSIMRHRCSIERDAGTQDEFGAEVATDWQPHIEDQPCRFWQRFSRGDTESVDTSRTVTVDELRLIMPLGVDVTPADRIASVKNRLGTSIVDGPLQIDSITVKSKFCELSLRSTI